MRLLRITGIILVVGTLPFLLAFSNARWLALDQGFYTRGFVEQQVDLTTGMTGEQLTTGASQIISYFQGGPPVSLIVDKEWGSEPVFNPKEADHMVDVRTLVWQVFALQTALAVLFGLGVAATIAERPGDRLRRLAMRVIAGGVLTFLIFVGLLVGALFDFPTLFLSFHLVSFTNLGWILDPQTDYLIRMFPYGFWYNAAVLLVGGTLLEGALLLAVAVGYLRLRRRSLTAERLAQG